MAGPQAARVLFGAGVPGASRGAAIVCSLSLAWGFGEVAGYARALDGKPTRAPWFYGTHVASVASGAAIVWIAPDLVSLNVAAQGIHAAMLPLVAGLLVAPAAIADDVAAAARELPPHVRLGTSSWYFPGWKDIVYGDDYAQSKLSREGLEAYAAHPLLKSVSLDRSFYAPLTVANYLRYAQQVPDDFRFVVKAPALVTDAVLRGARGEPTGPNPAFLNAQLAADEFVRPCLEGLGNKAGALVFQFPPLPDTLLADPAALVDRLSTFLGALPALPAAPDGPRYAVEIRDASLLTPRFIRALAAAGVRYCVGLHAKMPDPLRQAAALALLDGEPSGPLIVRWSLHGGFKYEQAKAKYEPFDQLVDEDPHTRTALAELAARYVLAGQPVLITVNNKAEGSAPLSCIALAKEIAAACARWRGEAA